MWLSMGVEALERGWVPDAVARAAIRKLCRTTLTQQPQEDAFVETLRQGPIAQAVEKANEQHYEVPAEFFAQVLGPHRKYSCCLFETDDATLANAEAASLRVTCERAQLAGGQRILELGCGWGSLSLWMAERYPTASIVSVSNSASQRKFIESEAQSRGLRNLRIVTADMNGFRPTGRFDRVVSVEMFEHMYNLESLLERISDWLEDDGRLFVHHFCHRILAYPYETAGADNWMGRYFFTGGMMPSERLLNRFDRNLHVVDRWSWSGVHYQKTSEAWLRNLDRRRREVMPILEATYGARDAARWFRRWRIFLLAVAELFGMNGGDEWYVAHSLLAKPRVAAELRA